MTPKRQVCELALNNEFNQTQKYATSRTGFQTPRTARSRDGGRKKSRVLTALLNNSRLSYHPKVFYSKNKFKLQDVNSPGTTTSFN